MGRFNIGGRLFIGVAMAISGLVLVPETVTATTNTASVVTGSQGIVPMVTAGVSHTCALLNDGNITCWGYDGFGQLGNGTITGNIDAPPATITLPGNATATAITAGSAHTCALLNTGNITCWGWDGFGQLGNGASTGNIDAPPTPITLPSPGTATAITAGGVHTCALLKDGNITCWGRDYSGQLGNGTGSSNIDTPPATITLPGNATATAITAGADHTCALLNDGNITCWGYDGNGQLGNGAPTGNIDAPPATITLPGNATATAITAGSAHTCALLNTGNITCWGWDGFGQLGNGAPTGNIAAPPAESIRVPNGAAAAAIAGGDNHTCALLNDGNITCWGRDFFEQLGNGAGNSNIDTPPATITLPSPGTATAITAGGNHTCALLNDGNITCWGADASEQLGNGAGNSNIDTPPPPVALPATLPAAPTPGTPGTPGTPAATVPGTPASPAAVAGDASATVTWTAPADTGASAIIGYRIEKSTDGAATWVTAIVSTANSATTAVITGLVNGTGVQFRIAAINAVGTSAPSAATATVTPVAATPPTVTPVEAGRLYESRSGANNKTFDGKQQNVGRTLAGKFATINVTGRADIPNDATAVFLNVVAANPSGPGYLTVFACGTKQPLAANVNYNGNDNGNDISFNAVLAKIGTNGNVCIYTSTATDLVIDVNGYVPASGSLNPISPARLYESRSGTNKTFDGKQQNVGRTRAGKFATINVTGRAGVPTNATAVFLNVVAVNPSGPGYLTVFACGTKQPLAANVNYNGNDNGNDISFNAVLAKIGTNGNVCIYTSTATDLVIDVNGYVPASGSLNPISPARLYESRSGTNKTFDGKQQNVGRTRAGKFATINVTGRAGVPNDATAVFLNVVAANPSGPGFLTVFACGTKQPLAANVNYNGNDIRSNAVLAKIGTNGTICIYTTTDTDLIIDVNGYIPAS
jgi:alpha-tubulin suppressor-like RCC1 family protein